VHPTVLIGTHGGRSLYRSGRVEAMAGPGGSGPTHPASFEPHHLAEPGPAIWLPGTGGRAWWPTAAALRSGFAGGGTCAPDRFSWQQLLSCSRTGFACRGGWAAREVGEARVVARPWESPGSGASQPARIPRRPLYGPTQATVGGGGQEPWLKP